MRTIEVIKGIAAVAIVSGALMAFCGPTRADLMPTAPQTVTTTTDSQSTQSPNPPRPKVGFDIGEYLPLDKVVQNRFGSQWFEIGLGEGQIPSDETKGVIRFELDLLTNARGDNRAILIPLGVEYEVGLGTGSITPYVGVGAEIVPSVIQAAQDHVKSQLRAEPGASAYAGLNFNHDAQLEIRYRAMENTAGYDFNGAEATLGIRF